MSAALMVRCSPSSSLPAPRGLAPWWSAKYSSHFALRLQRLQHLSRASMHSIVDALLSKGTVGP